MLTTHLCPADPAVLSPNTAEAASTLLQCRESAEEFRHDKLRKAANDQLVPYRERMATVYNKSARVKVFKIGDHVGLQIPVQSREKLDDRYIVCMVVATSGKDAYRLRSDHGMIQGAIRTDQLVQWTAPHSFEFTAQDDVSKLKPVTIAAVAKHATRANNQPAVCQCKAGCKTNACTCRKAGVQCTARCHVGKKCQNWGKH